MAIYTCILLDADNTLLDFNAAERRALAATMEQYELPYSEETLDTYHTVNGALWAELSRGQLTRSKLFATRFARFLRVLEMPDNGKAREMNDFYENQLALQCDLLPGALSLLEELSEVATLAIVTNGAAKVQQARLEASGINRFVDGVYISEQVGAEKPSPKIYEMALRDLGVTNRSRVLVVGDDLIADIKGGHNTGLDTCWVNFAGQENDSGTEPKYVIRSFEELYKIVMEPEELDNIGVRSRRHMNEV